MIVPSDVPYAFSTPLGSLYTLSLFTTLSVGDVVQRELGGHIAQFQGSHPSGILNMNESAKIANAPASVRLESHMPERKNSKESEKAFGWAKAPGVGENKADELV